MTDWSHVVTRHGPIVWQTAWRLLGHEADAADCFQNVFVSALEVSRREPVRNWPGLLKRLATARALERLRGRHRESSRLERLPDRPGADAKAAAPEEAAQTAELAENLRRAVAELDPRQGQVFCLACLEGLSYRQIAEQLELSLSHVGVLLNRARASLRERLEAFAPEQADERFTRETQP
ncbi:MAG: RNA polymerase sigma factor [Planctomycetota bacterium]|jgi:RNA polymerase sigma-70 factor (ECF subfamily)